MMMRNDAKNINLNFNKANSNLINNNNNGSINQSAIGEKKSLKVQFIQNNPNNPVSNSNFFFKYQFYHYLIQN